ncbi:hypothetical protein [Phytohabitans rumicis]|uniref:Uncharacterized protein n=1 Tax=Phytohabitans rumicis TaxID=1076125 RepID=A0A6V8L6B6_9ACTN|nr:hypothetical protein [Phytohabitans rumicis]GFJ91764.1 hypothetical protein Prum_054060 [Phytohabitans rumicis]
MAWYLAPSLAVLRSEVNTRWPQRDKTSDGTIGDPAHQQRPSDHNPNARESVDAWDMDKDGVDVDEVIRAFERHPSANYWIWNRQIADKDTGWRPEPYNGDNAHTLHVHFSIRQNAAAEQDQRAWGLLEDTMTPAEFVKILDDPQVQVRMRRLPWQYVGGGIPVGLSTLNVLNAVHTGTTNLVEAAAAEVLRDATLRTVLIDQLVAALREELDELPAEQVEAATERAMRRVLGGLDVP